MDEPIRILQVVNVMDRAGLETMLMNYYRNIDRKKIQFDFLVHRNIQGAYDNEIESLGGKIYKAPRLMPQNYIKYFKFMKNFFDEHAEYKIVHSHIDAMSTFPLRAAKKSNIKVRIAHSHSSKLDKDLKLPIKYISKKLLPIYATDFFACGKKAGDFLFKNKNFKLVNNAIDLAKFKFNEEIRKETRDSFGIEEDTLVIGHVGRYIYIKNQSFLIDVFSNVLKINNNSCLLLIGAGEDEKMLRDKVKKLNIESKVKFLIDRADVNRLYQIMDYFVMPSLFEGLPVVAIEAQANGLPCIFSDKISKEVLLISNSIMLSLDLGAQEWARQIVNICKQRQLDAQKKLSEFNYDIKLESEKLADIYLNLLNKEAIK